ncbi:hypothetical protein [Rhizobium sp. L43]|uniref:hypothetical protein n=1 Tax=Rhizobium sp. L43 TaxID=2035452 RepID=UPI0015CF38CF|nr:hypothetical protein [Rhizobium sp. L43]
MAAVIRTAAMKANGPNLFASAVNFIEDDAWFGDHDAAKDIRCRDRISVFIWAARGRMRARQAAGAFPASNRRLICSTQIFWQPGDEKALTVAG